MASLSTLFARRYLFSKKSHSVINIISGVSAFAVSIPVAAMIILLSVFNGFEDMVKSMYQQFDPDITVTPLQGKVFPADDFPAVRVMSIDGIEEIAYILEENALFEYRGRQYIGVIRGVDEAYRQVVPVDSLITDGKYRLELGDYPEAVVGQGVAYALGIRTRLNDPISIYTPRRGQISSLLPYSIYRKEDVYPAGIYALDAEHDGKYIIVSLGFAQELLDYPGKIGSVAVRLRPGVNAEKIQQQIQTETSGNFKVLTRYQQHETFYRIMMYEKWGIYFIILLVLIVASFSLIGSLVMLIIDKRKDIQTLITLGADIPLVRRIFTKEGMLIYLTGAFAGLILGLLFAWAQQQFGFIKIGGETFLIDAYPVRVKLLDLVSVVVTFTALSWMISMFTVKAMVPRWNIRPETHPNT